MICSYLLAGTSDGIFSTRRQIKAFIFIFEFRVDAQRRFSYASNL